jgi:voltage-gated potassium channel
MSGDETASVTDQAQPFYRELPSGRIEHRAEALVLVLALLVIPAIVLEEASADWLRTLALGLNIFIWVGFALELAFVLRVSRHRGRTLRAHWLDAAIVVLSVPVMPAFLQGARALRILRLLRFVRLALFGGRAIAAARNLFSPTGIRYVSLLVLLLIVISGAALTAVEAENENIDSIEDGMWWAVSTVTTVGYGDVIPETRAGRALAAVVMFLGIGFVALLTATVAATFVKQDERPDELHDALREISQRLERIESQLGEQSRNEP